MSLRIYYAPGSCAFAALAALECASADYEPARLDFAAGDQRLPGYLRINPLGRVPALTVGGTTITEVTGVLTFIAAQFPRAGLLSFGDPLRLAREYEWMAWFSTSLHLHIAQIFRGDRFGQDADMLGKLKANGLAQFEGDIRQLANGCEDRNSLLSVDRFTVINALSLVAWRWAQRLNLDDMTTGSAWAKVIDHDFQLPAVQRATTVEQSAERWPEAAAAHARPV